MRSNGWRAILPVLLAGCVGWVSTCVGEELLFEDRFDHGLSAKWQAVGLDQSDYRVREGALEIRLRPWREDQPHPMLKIDLPFGTADTVVATVEVRVQDAALQSGERTGICLYDPAGLAFTGRVANFDGHLVFAPGLVEFIGKLGEEGDPGKYTVKYWPADEAAGPLRILLRGEYAHFQVGPAADGAYRTFFHSAVRSSEQGMGWGLFAIGVAKDGDRWVRFDNFRVTKP